MLHYDAARQFVGIDIDNASRNVQLQRLVLTGMYGRIEQRAN